jgi:hypothetical protein
MVSLTEIKSSNSATYSDAYKQSIFALWYKSGKPTCRRLQPMILEPDPITGDIPTVNVLMRWISDHFKEQAEELDQQVGQQLTETLVAEKVEMLKRHATVSREMQKMGLDYLRENGVGGARNAIQLLVEGLEIERGAVGAPQIAQKLLNMSDEQLVEELKQLVVGSPIIDIQPNDISD